MRNGKLYTRKRKKDDAIAMQNLEGLEWNNIPVRSYLATLMAELDILGSRDRK